MSRSTRKAIYKDKGFAKESYWRIHRRVNKQINKHFFTSATHVTNNYWNFNPDELYFDTIQKYIDQGMDDEEATIEANFAHEDDWWFEKIAGNNYKSWWEYPEFKKPKELINDYDYCDYIIDEENDWSTFSYNLEVEHREDRKEILAKMRRK